MYGRLEGIHTPPHAPVNLPMQSIIGMGGLGARGGPRPWVCRDGGSTLLARVQREVVLQRQAMSSQAPTFEPGTDYIAAFLGGQPASAQQISFPQAPPLPQQPLQPQPGPAGALLSGPAD